jgi:hypothetical protein
VLNYVQSGTKISRRPDSLCGELSSGRGRVYTNSGIQALAAPGTPFSSKDSTKRQYEAIDMSRKQLIRIVEHKHLLHQVLTSVVKIVLKDSRKQLICLGSN